MKALKSGEGLVLQLREMGEAHVIGLLSNIAGTTEISFSPDLWPPFYMVVIFLFLQQSSAQEMFTAEEALRGLPEGHEVHPSLQIVWIISQDQGKPSKLNS